MGGGASCALGVAGPETGPEDENVPLAVGVGGTFVPDMPDPPVE